MQNSGQTTVVLFGNALDPRGRTNHPQPASPRPHGKPVAPVLAKNQPVWRSRPSKTSVTGRTLLDDDEFGESWHHERAGLLEFLVANFGHRLDDALDVLARDLVRMPLDDSLNEFRLRHSVSHLYPLSYGTAPYAGQSRR